MIKTIVTGLLWIKLKDLTHKQIEHLKDAYTYAHPYEETSSFETFVEHKEKLGIPFGNEDKVKSLLSTGIQIIDERVSPKFDNEVEFKGFALKDYQEDANVEIKDYFNSNGTTFNLAGKPGSGKTYMLSYLLSEIKGGR